VCRHPTRGTTERWTLRSIISIVIVGAIALKVFG
jgi:hypothetical protein